MRLPTVAPATLCAPLAIVSELSAPQGVSGLPAETFRPIRGPLCRLNFILTAAPGADTLAYSSEEVGPEENAADIAIKAPAAAIIRWSVKARYERPDTIGYVVISAVPGCEG